MNQPNLLQPQAANSEFFSDLIRAKEKILERLLPISERQLKLVREGDVSLLLQLLGQKQKMFDEFEKIERRLAPHRDVPPESRRWKSEKERVDTEAAIARCTERLAEILRLDEQSMQEMSEQKTAVEEQVRRLHQGSRLHAAYSRHKRG